MNDVAELQEAFAATLWDEWARGGVSDAVVAPGSRSTPLLVALARLERHGRIRLHVVLDERSAGFVALGIAAASGHAAVVVTTSGTAAVELHPAIVEAHHAGVPLLAVTADRPAELHGVRAPQTVLQEGLFAGTVRFSASPGVPQLRTAWSWRSLASRCLAETACSPGGPGPVHLNLAFTEPLVSDRAGAGLESGWASPGAVPEEVWLGRPDGAPWHRVTYRPGRSPEPEVVSLLARFAGGRGLVVAGAACGDAQAVVAAAKALGWPLLADPRSGARLEDAPVVAAADSLLRCEAVAAWHPEVVLHLGEQWASKVLAQWLAGLPAEVPQVLVDPFGRWADPARRASLVVSCDPGELCRAICAAVKGDGSAGSPPDGGGSPWLAQWMRAEEMAQWAIDAVLEEVEEIPGAAGVAGSIDGGDSDECDRGDSDGGDPAGGAGAAQEAGSRGGEFRCLQTSRPMTEPGLARALLDAMPTGSVLVASSSMPVRDLEWYARPRSGVRVLANRGANGIDGVVSTVLGVAIASASERKGRVRGASDRPGMVVGLLGDLAFLYDSAALVGASRRDVDATFVVVDNNGGGIFSFLPQAHLLPVDVFERLWATPHGSDPVAVASGYGVDARRAGTLSEVVSALNEGPGVRVVVVPSERSANVAIHDRLNRAVMAAVVGP